MRPVPADVKEIIEQWMADNKGHVYAPILHPDYAHVPFQHGPERFEMIRPHLGYEGGTVLDIGTHWGYIPHRLEDLGYKVTAVEIDPRLYRVTEGLRDAVGKKFKVINTNIFDLKEVNYDIVFALNIFHHFLKREERYKKFIPFLERMKINSMIFQSHRYEEPQMRDSFMNLQPDAFAELISRHSGLNKIEEIGAYGRRRIFKLTRG